jgi:thiamine biosynthesis lipoprotein
MNRRDFLRPQQLLGSAVKAFGLGEKFLDQKPETDIPLTRYARRAMATTFEVLLPVGTIRGAAAASAALDLIDQLEDQLTVYRDTSEMSRINRQAAVSPQAVEEKLFDLLTMADRLTQETEGAFDIAVGAMIKAWGFYRRRGRVPAPEERSAVMDQSGMRHVHLDPARRTISFCRQGLEINLGSIGKGYALDRVGQLLRGQWGIKSALLHGGHSSVLAIGSQPATRRGWPVGILHPQRHGRRLAIVNLRNRALGTSAATFQHLRYEGRKLGHILDPRTGWPGEGVLSASVTAPTAAFADALATAFYVMGVEKAQAYCAGHPGIGAVILTEGGKQPIILGHAQEEIDSSCLT